jgi:hypothetical protein
MEDSILISTKKILGIAEDYNAFDLDVITHINSSLAIVNQLGVGPVDALAIEDELTDWNELVLPQNQLSLVRTYIFLRVRMLFDPPGTSFLIDAMNKQIQEHEQRLSYMREELIPLAQPEEVVYE